MADTPAHQEESPNPQRNENAIPDINEIGFKLNAILSALLIASNTPAIPNKTIIAHNNAQLNALILNTLSYNHNNIY